jgi:hypothetical protein
VRWQILGVGWPRKKKSQSDPLYHLSHGQRGSDGFLSEPVTWLALPFSQMPDQCPFSPQ